MKRAIKTTILMVGLSVSPLCSWAGGVGINATRIIYTAQSKSVSTSVRNNDTKNTYLAQVNVSATPDGGDAPFIVTPPLFRLESGAQNQVRITKTGEGLPGDRESLFWFSMQAIPSAKSLNGVPTRLVGAAQISLGTTIKLIYRPQGLPMPPERGFGLLQFSRAADGIKITNPSPYYVSFFSFKVGGREFISNSQPVKMVAPKSEVVMPAKNVQFPAKVSWVAINDIGGELAYQGEAQ